MGQKVDFVVKALLMICIPSVYATSQEQCIHYCPKDCFSHEEKEESFFFSCSTAKHNCDCNSNPPKLVRGPFAPTSPSAAEEADEASETFEKVFIIVCALVGACILIVCIAWCVFLCMISNRTYQQYPGGYNFYNIPVVASPIYGYDPIYGYGYV